MITDHIYEWTLPTGETLRIWADLVSARSPIMYEADGVWYSTPYKTADARHRPSEALRLVLAYLGPDYYLDPTDDRPYDEIINAIVEAAKSQHDPAETLDRKEGLWQQGV